MSVYRFLDASRSEHSDSQFINIAAGKKVAPASDNPTSRDVNVRHFILQNPRPEGPEPRSLVFVDAPGFDHIDVPDDEIIATICEWLRTS